jgi:hypothetical protein
MRTVVSLLAGLTAASCATTESFTPAERATAISPEGYAAADYEMTAEGERLGDAIVWSDGAYRSKGYGDRTVVHVGFKIENEGEEPIELDTSAVEIRAETDDRVIRKQEPDVVEGSRTISPGGEGTVHLYFVMPSDVSPQDLDSFRVNWSADAGGLVYHQRTPFLEQRENYAYGYAPFHSSFYYTPFYDPFFYPGLTHRGLIVRPFPYRHYRMHSARR